MTDREALYRAILDNPDDDTLRLIYADALEEEGDDRRAAFIRSQVRLAAIPEYDPAWFKARRLESDLLAAAIDADELHHLPEGLSWSEEPFRRGFPAAIEAPSASAFLNAADDMFSRAPIESLDLEVAQLGEAQGFASSQWRHRLVRMSVTHGFSGPAARKWFGDTAYERLRELHIGAGLTTDRTCRAIVRSRVFNQLTALASPGNNRLVEELTQLDDPPPLRKLELARSRLTADELSSLASSRIVNTIEELDVSDSPLGIEGIDALSRIPRLRSLNLSGTRLERETARALCDSDMFSGLRRLNLSYLMTPAAAEELAGSSRAANLGVLSLAYNQLADEGVFALAASPYLKGLMSLDLSNNGIGDAGATALLDSPHLTGLLVLNLAFNPISAEVQDRLLDRFGAGVQD